MLLWLINLGFGGGGAIVLPPVRADLTEGGATATLTEDGATATLTEGGATMTLTEDPS